MNTPRNAGRFAAVALVAAGVALWSGCSSATDPWAGVAGPPRVLVSFPPLDSFVKNVAGDRAGVLCLCTNVGPHDYQYNVHDTLLLKGADLFVANGLGLDDGFTDKMHESCGNPRLKYLKLGKNFKAEELLAGGEHVCANPNHKHDGDHDPHLWLGVPEAIKMVEGVRDALKNADSAHAAEYEKNAAAYVERLRKLHEDGKASLKDKQSRNLVTMHGSLGYFCRSFGVNVVGTVQSQPGVEPDPKKLAELVHLCKNEKVRVIAVEPQYPENTAARALRDELKKDGHEAVLVVLDPMETASVADLGADYYARTMGRNLDNLAKHLR